MWMLLSLLFFQDATTSSPDLTLQYPSANVSPTVAREMLDALDEEYSRVRHELGCVIGSKISVIIVPLGTWEAAGNSPWSGGSFDGRIQVPMIYERSRVSPRMRQVFAHEIVHACIARFGEFPTWLHEGLAQKLSGEQISADWRRSLRQELAAGRLPGLEKLSGRWGQLNSDQARTAYAYALWAIDLWMEADGGESVRQFLKHPERAEALTDRLNQALRR